MASSFEARYPGECVAGCGEEIKPGQLIVNAGGKQYMHEGCAREADALQDGPRYKFQGTTLEEMGF